MFQNIVKFQIQFQLFWLPKNHRALKDNHDGGDGAGVRSSVHVYSMYCTLIWSWGIGTRTLSLKLLVRGNGHVSHVIRLHSDTWESKKRAMSDEEFQDKLIPSKEEPKGSGTLG